MFMIFMYFVRIQTLNTNKKIVIIIIKLCILKGTVFCSKTRPARKTLTPRRVMRFR